MWESRSVAAPYLVEVLLFLLYFGNVEQQAPHLPSELQGNSLIDPSDQLEGGRQEVVNDTEEQASENTPDIYTWAAWRVSERYI